MIKISVREEEIREIEKEISEIEKDAIYKQIDNVIKVMKLEGVEILTIEDAYKKYDWVKKYIRKPLSGYFMRIEGVQKAPISTCFLIERPNIRQNLTNLIVLEKGAKVLFRTLCASALTNISSVHTDYTKLIMKENSEMTIEHIHRWGNRSFVAMSLDADLEKNAKLNYTYRSLESPRELYSFTKGKCHENATANVVVATLAEKSKIIMNENFWLQEDNASAIVKLRVVGKEKGFVKATSRVVAEGTNTKGHLDCQGLMVADDTELDLVPELNSKNRTAMLTHEASIGRITDDVLTYLKARGLTENEAIDLIVSGFLSTKI